MNLKDYLLKEENKEVLITLIENKNEFDNYAKNDEECKKIIEEENLSKVLEDVLLNLRKEIAEEIFKQVQKVFDNYQVTNEEFSNEQEYGYFIIYKKNWTNKSKVPLIMYGLEWAKLNLRGLYYGISKYNENIPYQNQKIPEKLKEVFDIDKTFNTSNWWLTWKYFNPPYNLDRYDFWQNDKSRKLYLEIVNSDLEEFVKNHYIKPLKKYIDKTENVIENYLKSLNSIQFSI